LRIWSIETGKEIVALPGETATGSAGLQAVAFSADGKTLAAGDTSGRKPTTANNAPPKLNRNHNRNHRP